jgi:prolyl oligopeptidase
MRKSKFSLLRSLFLASSFLYISFPASGQSLNYPVTRKSDQVDEYHGVKVADPYRWLEDDNSAETAEWVKAENAVTFAYLEKIPYRAQVKHRLEQLYNYARYTPPARRGDYYYFSKNDGLQNQNVIYLQATPDASPELLLDPNKFSDDGTSRLSGFNISKDGRYAAYGISVGGSDWQEGHVMEVATRKVLPDDLKWLKFTAFAWSGDGFFYSRYPAPELGHELSSKNELQSVYFHRVGTPQSEDKLVYEDKVHPLRFIGVGTTEDEHFAFLYISEESAGTKGNALLFRDLSKNDSAFTPIVSEISDDIFSPLEDVDGKFMIFTNRNAPNGKVLLYDPAHSSWSDIVPEKSEVIGSADLDGGKLFITYLKDVASHISVFGLNGKFENEVKLPGAGSVSDLKGNHKDNFVFFSFESPISPLSVFRYDISSNETTLYRTPKLPGFTPDSYESKQVLYTSKDGTRVPMFVTYKKGLQLDGKNPTLLYGYGGFNITNAPYFRPFVLALLEQGFVFASANMRGGGEYGEKWHEAGTKLKKQNVFDDFIAAAEWLIANKYTSSDRLAVNGGSNGGLLIGAVVNQRPELFKVAVPQVGVMDMLRFQRFTIGSAWISDYGSSDNPAEFKALYAYSPLHNIRPGAKYPATLIATADHDDRVVPAHSFKYAATLQALASHDNPILIRIETKSGHGASSTTKNIEITSDVYSFIFYNLGITPKY